MKSGQFLHLLTIRFQINELLCVGAVDHFVDERKGTQEVSLVLIRGRSYRLRAQRLRRKINIQFNKENKEIIAKIS